MRSPLAGLAGLNVKAQVANSKRPKPPAKPRKPLISLPPGARRRVLLYALVAYVVLLLGVGGHWNWRLFDRASDLHEQALTQIQAVERLPALRQQMQAADAAYQDLLADRQRLYALIPDHIHVPVMIRQLESLGTLVGGVPATVEYRSPQWRGDVGRVGASIRLEGNYAVALRYMAALDASFASATFQQIGLEKVGAEPGRMVLTMNVDLGVMNRRPEHAPPWNRQQVRAVAVAPAGYPFTPPPIVWGLGSVLNLDLPNVGLSGIADQGGNRLALIHFEGEARLLREGERIGGIEVVHIGRESVQIRTDALEHTLTLGGYRDAMAR